MHNYKCNHRHAHQYNGTATNKEEAKRQQLDERVANAYSTAEANDIKDYTITVRHIDKAVILQYVHETSKPFNLVTNANVHLNVRGQTSLLVTLQF